MITMPSSIRLYIALNPDLKPIGAQFVGIRSFRKYQCLHCHAELILHNEGHEYYFMHIDNSEEQKCSYCQAALNPLRRHLEFVRRWSWLPLLIPVTRWYCVLCQRYYEGEKCCPCCQQSVYSTEPALRDTSSVTKSDWS